MSDPEQPKSEKEVLDRRLACGDIKAETTGWTTNRGHCGTRDWRVSRPYSIPPWSRMLVCGGCGAKTFITIVDLVPKEHFATDVWGLSEHEIVFAKSLGLPLP